MKFYPVQGWFFYRECRKDYWLTEVTDNYTIGLDTDQGTLRELTVDELSDADKLPEGEYV